MPKRNSLALSLMVAMSSPFTVLAEHAHLDLETMTVSEQALETVSNQTGALSQQDIDALEAAVSDTAGLLKGLPGVSIYGAGGVSSLPAIHGLADDRLRIKVDGMDLISACANHMNPPLSYINPTNVSSLKVHAGISPVSMGGDSIGGSILVESTQPEFV
jgi:iron complex outermembrane receptor protein